MNKRFTATTRALAHSQLLIPLLAFFLLIVFNLIRDPSFFSVALVKNNLGNMVLSGNLISIIDNASELALLAIGMTLVTAASKGQDISVGAAATIAGSVFINVLRANDMSLPMILFAFLASCVVAMLFGAFNGTLVALFKIQPMIATLILYTAGRDIAYWINGGASPDLTDKTLTNYFGTFFPGIPIPTPILLVCVCLIIMALILKFTNLGLYAQAVGINENAARLNGIDPVRIKLLVFIILGICVALAGSVNVCRMGSLNHKTALLDIEMDAILAVAIGGNALIGGKFSMVGSVMGAYIIRALQTTLYAMEVSSDAIKAYKAVVIIAIVLIGSPVVKKYASLLFSKLRKNTAVVQTGDL
ncbi:MAG: ABC transporter permease [Clostridiales Family XIII bacterium]|jgi:simple sugar transport system permease protein|nr:ABC transporter permease [Clostridiales Family XIII bacterium]